MVRLGDVKSPTSPTGSPLDGSLYVPARRIAARYSLTPHALLRLARKGDVPHLRLSRKIIRFCPDHVDAVLRERAAATWCKEVQP